MFQTSAVLVSTACGDVLPSAAACQPGAAGKLPANPTGQQLSAILTHTVLITHHTAPLQVVAEQRASLERHPDHLGRGPDYLFHRILDEMVDEYAPLLDTLVETLDRAEARIFRKPTRHVLGRLLRLKRTVIQLRKTLVLEREVLARLARGDFALIDEREQAYYRNVYDHLVRYTELAEGTREMLSDLMQSHLAAASNRLNEIMKVLTMISTIGLVCTLITGIYGMNFEKMPGLKWEHGFWLAIGLMGSIALVTTLFFKWRRWL